MLQAQKGYVKACVRTQKKEVDNQRIKAFASSALTCRKRLTKYLRLCLTSFLAQACHVRVPLLVVPNPGFRCFVRMKGAF